MCNNIVGGKNMSHLLLIILGFSIIFIATTLGAATIYLFKNNISQKINTLFLGFAGGIMVAASIWSLIIPSISQSEENMGKLSFIPAAIGIILGGLFLVGLDKIIFIKELMKKKDLMLKLINLLNCF